ncbi:MAG: hypothetical protein IKP88_10235 [Lachnospiraceae bacterium]|nr:hypothetical protein [Lachnospiraceae bacterium]
MNKRVKNKTKPKVRLIYKILLVLAVFIGSLIFFGGGIKETLFDDEQATTTMRAASFPLISMEVSGREMNLLHGFAGNLDSQIIRECITPVTNGRSLTVNIKESGSDVKKLKYEIFTLDGKEKEEESYTLLEDASGKKNVTIDLKETYETGSEYILKITLITGSSKRIYYYTRIKLYEDGKLDEKLDFIINFHKTLLNPNGKRAEELMEWLEPNRSTDHSTFSNVNIRSRLNMVSYGDLNPEVVYEQLPTITEFYENYASVRMDYVLGVETELGVEYYRAEEHYRIGLSGNKTYLYNYERTMEEFFDMENFSVSKKEFKLGICEEDAVSTAISPNGKYMAFVYGGELIFYDIENNTAALAFSFRKQSHDFEREVYRNYDIKILRVLDDGTMDFYVSGYMNSGEYEGRVGMILYTYEHAAKIREERLYMPINSSYQVLSCDLSDFAYIGDKQIFYFSIYDRIYSYDLASANLETIAENIDGKEIVFCEEENYLAWKEQSIAGRKEAINMLHLDDGRKIRIETPADGIRLFGRINNNLVYGFEKASDGIRQRDGSIDRPCYRVMIADGTGNILKTYEEQGILISDIELGENIITIKRVTKNETYEKYDEIESDTILNRLEEKEMSIPVIKYVTDRMLTEYSVAIPTEAEIENRPILNSVGNKVLNHETIARIPEPEKNRNSYYTYSFGRIVESSESATEAIAAANENVGTVINREGQLIWERGIKMPRTEIRGLNEVKAGQDMSSVQAVIKMLAQFRNCEIDESKYVSQNESIYEFLCNNMEPHIVDMTGSELDDVLYCVYRGHPVIAVRGNGEACIIFGYEPSNVTIYDPVRGSRVSLLLSDAIKDFKKSGNIFISYVG